MASSKPAELVLPAPGEQPSGALHAAILVPGLPLGLVHELWRTAEAESCGLSVEEFGSVLTFAGAKANYNLPPGTEPDDAQRAAFFRGLHLGELALALACARGREAAWELFLGRYRSALIQMATAITGSATLGRDLADSLYAELYGLREAGGERRSPLASYSGRGSLAGWLRTTLVQRSRDHHRRTYRETPLDTLDSPAPRPEPIPSELPLLTTAIARTLRSLTTEDRFLLSAYYIDRQTLLTISRTLHVHEATISRRLRRLAESLRKQLLENLISAGLSPAAAEEALGADPRDIEINLPRLLQTSQTNPFSQQTASTPPPDTA
jgi:RNA polymerase sigma-70 factor (ECF subfamily)